MDNTQQQNTTQQNTIVEFPKDQGNVQQTGQGQPVTQPVQQQSGESGLHKELEPMPSLSAPTELLKPVEQHVELEPEVEDAGVEFIAPVPQITPEEKEIGVALAKETMPMEKEPTPQLNTSMTQAQAQQLVKGNFLFKNVSDPMIWLALLVLRQHQMVAKQRGVPS